MIKKMLRKPWNIKIQISNLLQNTAFYTQNPRQVFPVQRFFSEIWQDQTKVYLTSHNLIKNIKNIIHIYI